MESTDCANHLIKNLVLFDIFEKIKQFTELPQNWDGYNAIPLSKESADWSYKLLEKLSNESINALQEIYPNPHGTLSIEINNLFIEIGSTHFTAFSESFVLDNQSLEKNINLLIHLIEFH